MSAVALARLWRCGVDRVVLSMGLHQLTTYLDCLASPYDPFPYASSFNFPTIISSEANLLLLFSLLFASGISVIQLVDKIASSVLKCYTRATNSPNNSIDPERDDHISTADDATDEENIK